MHITHLRNRAMPRGCRLNTQYGRFAHEAGAGSAATRHADRKSLAKTRIAEALCSIGVRKPAVHGIAVEKPAGAAIIPGDLRNARQCGCLGRGIVGGARPLDIRRSFCRVAVLAGIRAAGINLPEVTAGEFIEAKGFAEFLSPPLCVQYHRPHNRRMVKFAPSMLRHSTQ
jgi:hypothetical protein